MTMNT
jgi:hypothetical protein